MGVESLFEGSLISSEAARAFPDGFVVRPLSRHDYAKGFFDCLRTLTWVGDPTESEFQERYDDMADTKGTYCLLCENIPDARSGTEHHEARIVGTGCLVVEKKLIHNLAKCGHVEEIAIVKEHQGKGLGARMMQALDSVAVNVGCYKSILNCGPRNEPFYAKCGYSNSGTEMSHYYEEKQDAYQRG
ncbi:acyl-CoA N-acyltransferase [Xylariaceae sp. FL0804]|nr:acyl-CoA N-acyltransferase [Xylariaceae sp. FL0804]